MPKYLIAFCVLYVTVHSCAPKQGLQDGAFQDCMKSRSDIETINNLEGKIMMISETYVIVSDDGNLRFVPCNLPDNYKGTEQKIRFSIVTKEIKPNERFMGTPCYLKSIEIVKN